MTEYRVVGQGADRRISEGESVVIIAGVQGPSGSVAGLAEIGIQIAEHEAKSDPHPVYATDESLTAQLAAHVAALDPHPLYALDTDLGLYLPLAGGTLSGPLLLPDGTSPAPSLAFASDPDTGFKYLSGLIYQVSGGSNNVLFRPGYGLSLGGDVEMIRDAANVLALRNGANAQTQRVYDVFTDVDNYRRQSLEWSGGNPLWQFEGAGSGSLSGKKAIFRMKDYGEWWLTPDWCPGGDGTRLIGAPSYRVAGIYLGGAAAQVPVLIKLHASQTADAFKITTGNDDVLAKFASDGKLTATIVNTPAGTIAATTVQDAINELDTEKVPTTRNVEATAPLSGGGALSANISLGLINDPNHFNVATDTSNQASSLGPKAVGVRVNNSANIVVASGSAVLMTFDTELKDTNAFHSTGSYTSRLVVPTYFGGMYHIHARVRFEGPASPTGYRAIYIEKNVAGTHAAANLLASSIVPAITTASTPTDVESTCFVELAAGDYVELFATHNQGANLNAEYKAAASGQAYSVIFEMYRIGA